MPLGLSSDYTGTPEGMAAYPTSAADLPQFGITDQLIASNPNMQAAGIHNINDFWARYQDPNNPPPNFGLAQDDFMGQYMPYMIGALGTAGMAGLLPGTTPLWGAATEAGAGAAGAGTSGVDMASSLSPATSGFGTSDLGLLGTSGVGVGAGDATAGFGTSDLGLLGTSGVGVGGSGIGAEIAGSAIPDAVSSGGFLPTSPNSLLSGASTLSSLLGGAGGALNNLLPLIGGLVQGTGSYLGSQQMKDAANQAQQLQMQMYGQNAANLSPWVQSGQGAVGALNQFMGVGPGGTVDPNAPGMTRFTPSDLWMDPSYQWRLGQGENALINQSAALGGVQSGNTLKALTNYAQGAASQEYTAANQRYQDYLNSVFNKLQSMSGTGLGAAGTTGALGAGAASAAGNYGTQAGTAGAAGTAGIANAITGTAGSIANNLLLQQLLGQSGQVVTPSATSAPSTFDFGSYYAGTPATTNMLNAPVDLSMVSQPAFDFGAYYGG